MEERTLRRLVRKASSGDREAAGAIFDEYHPRVYRYAVAKLRRPSDAEDVAAETFARVLRDLGRFRWKGAGFEAWLFRIANHLVVDHVRRAKGEVPVSDTFGNEELDDRTPESAFIAGETTKGLNDMLLRLPEEQREVLTLRFTAGLDSKETAKAMGRNPNAVRQLQFRALSSLRTLAHEEAFAAASTTEEMSAAERQRMR